MSHQTSLFQSQQDPVAPLHDESIFEEIKSTLPDHEAKINTLAQEVGSIKKSLGDTISNFNNSMQAIGADLTEMNNKYTQMNNFLMEIQTTQITVNNQILKHYNDNNSDLIETQITQSADESSMPRIVRKPQKKRLKELKALMVKI